MVTTRWAGSLLLFIVGFISGSLNVAAQSYPPPLAQAARVDDAGYFGVTSSFAARPGETIKGFGRGSNYESPYPIVHVIVSFDFQVIADTNGSSVNLEAPFSLTVAKEGNYLLTVDVVDSAGNTATTSAGVRISNDYIRLSVAARQPVLVGDPILLRAVTTFTNLALDYSAFGIFPAPQISVTPSNAVMTPVIPGQYGIRASAWVPSGVYSYFYASPDEFLTVLPQRLPVIIASWFPPQPAGATVTLNPTILSRDIPDIQWIHNGQNIPAATNSSLTISNLTTADAGEYLVHLENFAGAISSSVATLVVTNGPSTNGAVLFSSRSPNVDIQIRKSLPNGALLDAESHAQLYAGRSLVDMKPVGPVLSFRQGYFRGGPVQIPGVAPGDNAFVQVAVWDSFGLEPGPVTFEKRGMANWWRSKILQLTTTTLEQGGAELIGLEPFGLMIWDGYSMYAHLDPAEQTARPGSSVNMTSFASAFYTWTGQRVTNFIYQWSKDGQLLSTALPNLTFQNVQPSDAGIYRLAVTDGVEIKVEESRITVENPTPILRIQNDTTGALNWRLDAAAGTKTAIETSPDLIHWTPWKTFDAQTNGVFFSNIFTNETAGFVRATAQ